MAFAVLHNSLLGSPRGRTVGYDNGAGTMMIKQPKFDPIGEDDANIIDSNNQIKFKASNPNLEFLPTPIPVSITAVTGGPNGVMSPLMVTPVSPNTLPDIVPTFYPIDQNYLNIPPQVQAPVTTAPAPVIASYTPVDTSAGIFGTGNTGPSILTPITTQGAGTPSGANASLVNPVSVPLTAVPTPQASPGAPGTLTLFGYTAPKSTWLVIGVVVAALAYSFVGDSGSTRRR